jgi:hypothetical protein
MHFQVLFNLIAVASAIPLTFDSLSPRDIIGSPCAVVGSVVAAGRAASPTGVFNAWKL